MGPAESGLRQAGDEDCVLTRAIEPEAPVKAEEYLASQPPALEVTDALRKIRERVVESSGRVIVFDDDPTGTQTVHDVPVLTAW